MNGASIKTLFTLLLGDVLFRICGAEFNTIYYYRNAPSVAKQSDYPHEERFSNDNLKTVFVIHGWRTRDLQQPLQIKDALFQHRNDVGRVVLIDWTKESLKNQYGTASVREVPRVAQYAGREMTRIVRNGMTSSGNVEIVGHSLGAHIAGQAGRFLVRNGLHPVGLITGLDPAALDYSAGGKEYDNRLKKSDALTVVGIHTSSLGVKDDIGGSDIWVNSGATLENCRTEKLWKRPSCQHNAAWDAYINQLGGIPLFVASDGSRGRNNTVSLPPRKTSVNILVLDVSGSMQSHGRIQSLVVSSNRFVSRLPLGYHLGIVIFGTDARTSAQVTNISSESVRRNLIASLPTVHTNLDMTSIGAGLKMALDMAKGVPNSACADLILISDGEETADPKIKDVEHLINASCSKINSIALGAQAASGLERLSSYTRGLVFSVSDSVQDDSTYDTLTQTLLDSSDNQLDIEQRPIKLPSKKARVDDPTPTIFTIDDTVGKNTRFSISNTNVQAIEAIFTDPNGISYGKSKYNVSENNKEINFELEDVLPGNWIVMVKSASRTSPPTRRRRNAGGDSEQTATIFVTTNPRNLEEEIIRLDAQLSSNTIEYPNSVKIEAGILKGTNGIAYAEVNAHIKSSTGTVRILRLWDNGAGADESKFDGVYSRYISRLDGVGRFEVSVIATGGEKAAYMKNGEMVRTGPFERLVNVGSLKAVGNFVKPPPGRVTDLNVVSVDREQRKCTIMWTAQGDVEDVGKVAAFSIMATTNFSWADQYLNMYTFNETDVNNVTELEPKESGDVQTVRLRIPDTLWDNAIRDGEFVEIELYFTVQSRNEQQQLSEMSNVADTYTYYYSLRSVATSVHITNGIVLVFFIIQCYNLHHL